MNIIAVDWIRGFGMRSRGAGAGSRAARRPLPLARYLAIALRVLRLRTRHVARIVYDWWRLREAVVELESMPDRMLRDIGVTREEIRHVVRFGRGSLF